MQILRCQICSPTRSVICSVLRPTPKSEKFNPCLSRVINYPSLWISSAQEQLQPQIMNFPRFPVELVKLWYVCMDWELNSFRVRDYVFFYSYIHSHDQHWLVISAQYLLNELHLRGILIEKKKKIRNTIFVHFQLQSLVTMNV